MHHSYTVNKKTMSIPKHAGVQEHFYFGGVNYSYQNMDVAGTRFTSVARKLLGGL